MSNALPMTPARRRLGYILSGNREDLTPAQSRRYIKKRNRLRRTLRNGGRQ